MMNRMGSYFAALMFGAMLGVWGCWVQANDQHILTVGECMVRLTNESIISQQEAFLICEREAR